MARISRFKLKDEMLDKIFLLFFEVVGKKNNRKEFQLVIEDICSPTERIMMAKRVAIIYLLLKNIEYQTICSTLKVSTSTVAKFSLLLDKSSGIREVFQKILFKDKASLAILEAFDFLIPPGTLGTNWSAARERKQAIRQEKTRGI